MPLTKFQESGSTFIHEIKEDSKCRLLLKIHLSLSFHLYKDAEAKEAIEVKLNICHCFYGIAVLLGFVGEVLEKI
jgi:hypothetical protein